MPPHEPALLAEAIGLLGLRTGCVAVDATTGAGGHAEAIAQAVGERGTVIALDQDETALHLAQQRLSGFPQVRFVHANFRELPRVLRSFAIERVDAILADLGLASFHLDVPARGFSFASEELVDMRMDRSQGRSAAELLATAEENELGRILHDFGEEPRWRATARAIVAARAAGVRFTGTALREVVHHAVGAPRRRGVDAATLVFQALRIAVNDELGALTEFLDAALAALAPGGRLAVISYHSLEDRAVKARLRDEARGCICPPDAPRCTCGHEPRVRLLTRKPIVPTADEIERNPRARSAKLRGAERL
jgi:16S rRNA (cytosine1402-N4)-methyltransferase